MVAKAIRAGLTELGAFDTGIRVLLHKTEPGMVFFYTFLGRIFAALAAPITMTGDRTAQLYGRGGPTITGRAATIKLRRADRQRRIAGNLKGGIVHGSVEPYGPRSYKVCASRGAEASIRGCLASEDYAIGHAAIMDKRTQAFFGCCRRPANTTLAATLLYDGLLADSIMPGDRDSDRGSPDGD